MSLEQVKKDITRLLREQTEFPPEEAIAAMNHGDFVPACNLIEKIMDDVARKCGIYKNYTDRIVTVVGQLKDEMVSK